MLCRKENMLNTKIKLEIGFAIISQHIRSFKPLAIYCVSTVWFVSDIAGNSIGRLSYDMVSVEIKLFS